MCERMDTIKNPVGVEAATGPVDLEIELCKACGVCIELCPEKVFDRDKHGYPVLARPEDCSQCLLCELHCPDFAIEVRRRERKGKPAAEGAPLTRDHLVASASGVEDDGCAHDELED
jgi:2-oxoglutarate ferredoxin oxidoreductase subunit delta